LEKRSFVLVLVLGGLQPEKGMSEENLEIPERGKCYVVIYFAGRHLKHENEERPPGE